MTERQKGVLALVVTLLAWSLGSLFVKYLLQQGYDPHTQNFYRYLVGAVSVLPFLVMRLRQRGVRLNRSRLLRLTGPALPNVVHQVSWVVALQWVYPALTSFLNKSSVLFAALMAFVLFPEERWLFQSRRFLGGLVLTLAGTIGLAVLRGDLGDIHANTGVALTLLSAVFWAVYSVSVKRLTTEVGSTVCFGMVSIYTTLVLFPLAYFWGDLGHWQVVSWRVNAVLIISGVLCVGIAHTLYYYAIRVLGVSVCATMLLTTPLGTMLLSRWLFGEHLTTGQVVSGVLLLTGGALTLVARKHSLPVVRAVEAADS